MPEKFQTERRYVNTFLKLLYYKRHAVRRFEKAKAEPSYSGIHVASYLTDVLPKTQLNRKLHETVRLARARFAQVTYSKRNG